MKLKPACFLGFGRSFVSPNGCESPTCSVVKKVLVIRAGLWHFSVNRRLEAESCSLLRAAIQCQ